MKKILSLCFGCMLLLSLFTFSVSAASKNFSFNFNGAYVEGDTNGIFYNITHNKASVRANGNWRLKRNYWQGSQSATCSIALKKSVWGTDTNYGYKSIGTVSVENGSYEGRSQSFNISWTAGDASSKYYLTTSCSSASGDAYKVGSGTLSW